MNKVYCIFSGDYEDYHIDYTFTTEEERDKVFNIINQGCYHYGTEELEIFDGKFSFPDLKEFYYVKCELKINMNRNIKDFEFELIKTNNYARKPDSYECNDHDYGYYGNTTRIKYNKILLSNEKINEEGLKQKYFKICNDYYNKAEYYRTKGNKKIEDIPKILFND